MIYKRDEEKPKTLGEIIKQEESSGNRLIEGVPNGLVNQASAKRVETKAETDALKRAEGNLGRLESLTGKDNIISESTKNNMNQQFNKPYEVVEADNFLSQQLKKIRSGRTSYSDELQEIMDKIMGREKFSYDVDNDPLFQQALASAMNSGKTAMQDTIGQASALTGGYGSTYATSAGNQAYNAFIEDAYNNLPEYYNMALQAYQAEGDELYRQFGMYSDLDEKEYNRAVMGFDATSQYRNQLYNEAYGQYRDSVSDAYAMANLELSEHGQLVNDAYNLYSASSDYYENLYSKSYNEWLAQTSNAQWLVGTLSNEAWKNKEFDYNKEWNNAQLEYQKERDAVGDARWEKEYALNEKLTNAQIANMGRSGRNGGSELESPTQSMIDTALEYFNSGDKEKYEGYLNSLYAMGYDVGVVNYSVGMMGNSWAGQPWAKTYNYLNSFEIDEDKKKNKKDIYKSTYGGKTQYLTYDELTNLIYDEMGKEGGVPYTQRKELIDLYTRMSKK